MNASIKTKAAGWQAKAAFKTTFTKHNFKLSKRSVRYLREHLDTWLERWTQEPGVDQPHRI